MKTIGNNQINWKELKTIKTQKLGDTASGRKKGLLRRPSTKEAWTNLSTSWVLGLDPSNTDKCRPRYAQAFTNLFVYLSYLVTAKFQDVPNNSKRYLTMYYNEILISITSIFVTANSFWAKACCGDMAMLRLQDAKLQTNLQKSTINRLQK